MRRAPSWTGSGSAGRRPCAKRASERTACRRQRGYEQLPLHRPSHPFEGRLGAVGLSLASRTGGAALALRTGRDLSRRRASARSRICRARWARMASWSTVQSVACAGVSSFTIPSALRTASRSNSACWALSMGRGIVPALIRRQSVVMPKRPSSRTSERVRRAGRGSLTSPPPALERRGDAMDSSLVFMGSVMAGLRPLADCGRSHATGCGSCSSAKCRGAWRAGGRPWT